MNSAEAKRKRSVRVLRIIARLNVGGPAIHTALLSAGLKEKGYCTKLVVGQLAPGEGDMSDYARSLGVRPVQLPTLGRSVSPLDDLHAFVDILRIMLRFRPQVVHTHTAKAGMLGRLAAAIYNLRQRLIGRPRTLVIHTFHGHVFHGYFSPLVNFAIRWTERILGWLSDAVVTITPQQKNEICNIYGVIPPRKAVVIRLGFDLSPLKALDRQGRWHDPECLHIGIVGRLVPIKDHAMFLSGVQKYLSDPQNPRTRFHIIGGGKLEETLQNSARGLGIAEHVQFHGWIRDLSSVYTLLDLVTLTSKNEGTPVALIEAMTAGLPVVATAVGGVVDLAGPAVENLEEGLVRHERALLVSSRDAVSLAKGWSYLAKNEESAKKTAEGGRRFVLSTYGKERLLADLESLYRHLLKTD